MFNASDFRSKEVINLYDGEKLGYVCDLEIDKNTGHILTIIVPGKEKKKLFAKVQGIKIPWESIEKIGDDIITVKKTSGNNLYWTFTKK